MSWIYVKLILFMRGSIRSSETWEGEEPGGGGLDSYPPETGRVVKL